MHPVTIPGFRVDDDQCIAVPDACGWNDKAGTRWKCADFEAPPAKPRLMSFASGTTNYAERCPWDWQDEEQMSNDKPASDAIDWGKT